MLFFLLFFLLNKKDIQTMIKVIIEFSLDPITIIHLHENRENFD